MAPEQFWLLRGFVVRSSLSSLLTTARTLLRCHASPVRDGWLPCDSGQPWQAAPAWYGYPSLRSIQPAHDGSDASKMSCLSPLRVRSACHASQPAAVPRLPSDSGQTRSGCARPGLCPSLQSIRGAAGFGRFGSSLRIGTAMAGVARRSWLFLAPVQPGCYGGFALLHHSTPPPRKQSRAIERKFQEKTRKQPLAIWKMCVTIEAETIE